MNGKSLKWDRYSFIIDDKRIFFTGGEFHYWRIPDRDRWLDILKLYKGMGMNSIRIYFHWGFHNPGEDRFVFDGHRDLEYLFKLCEELGLYVFVAAGPYICAETNAGGYPGWLAAKKNIRIKHFKGFLRQKYDHEYMKYCRRWFEEFIAIMRPHQLTENKAGCVVAFQIENEYGEKFLLYRGLKQYMHELVDIALENGVTVPTFHNDVWEMGSWNDGKIDIVAFDKYPINQSAGPLEYPIPPWKISKFIKSTSRLEKRVQSFGPPASEAPLCIPELQGGWYNQWFSKYGYDELYDWYGSTYQRLVMESVAAQRCTMMVLYMAYGGTNYGSIGGPEVYTSYDYSACIREYGFQSDRYRYARLFNLFVHSFMESLSATDRSDDHKTKVSDTALLNLVRKSKDGTEFYFFRNMVETGTKDFFVTYNNLVRIPKQGSAQLDFKHSFVGVANHKMNDFTIAFSFMPIVIKYPYQDGFLLVTIHNQGEILLEGQGMQSKGDCKIEEVDSHTRISFPKPGFGLVQNNQGKKLYLISLTLKEALSLNAHFGDEVQLAWGAYSIYFHSADTLEVETMGEQQVKVLSSRKLKKKSKPIDHSPIPGIQLLELGQPVMEDSIALQDWAMAKIDLFKDIQNRTWKKVDKNDFDAIYHNYTSGHVLYQCKFDPGKQINQSIKINMRHKCGIWINGKCIGGHYTYHPGLLKPGTMDGPDLNLFCTKEYDLSPFIKPEQENTLIILLEHLGLNKQFWFLGDIRNPRGLMNAKFNYRNLKEEWSITGVDVTQLSDPFDLSALPFEEELRNGEGDLWSRTSNVLELEPEDQIVWLKTHFDYNLKPNVRMPLRVKINGKHNINLYLNGVNIGRYWGEAGPQKDFYLPERLITHGKNTLVFGCWTTHKDPLTIELLPYKVNPKTGNIDDHQGVLFKLEKTSL